MNKPAAGRAAFVKRPRTVEDLESPVGMSVREMDYHIVGVLTLEHTDYENFIGDMTVNRDFLADNMDGCGLKEKAECILVFGVGFQQGILVIPTEDGFVEYAAVYK